MYPDFDGKSILIYDIETNSLDIETAKVKWFGAYSYLRQEYILLPYKGNEKEIKALIAQHKVLVGFNNKDFDNPIIQNNINNDDIFEYKVILDFLEISAPKGGKNYGSYRKNRLAQMGIKLKNFTLKNIIEVLQLDKTIGTKGDIDYKIFQKDEWTLEEVDEIKKYLKQDIDLTMLLFHWYHEQFKPLMKFLPQKDQDNFLYLKSSLSVLGYNIICNKAGLKPEFGEKTGTHVKSYAGGHHLEPRWDLVRGNIIEVDFACLHKDTNVITPKGNKKISELQIGDKVKGVNGFEKVSDINKKKVRKIYKITLESGETVLATAEHRFPIKNIGDRRVDELKIGDDMITGRKGLKVSKKCVVCGKLMLLRASEFNHFITCSKECQKINRMGIKNSNYKNKLQKIKCPVCGKYFMCYKYSNHRTRKTCSKKCGNVLKSKNCVKVWLGKRKENTPQLMKLSLLKKGIKRTDEVINKIKEKRAQQKRTHTSSIEVKIQNYLKELKIPYFIHYYINIKHAYQCDIFIPSINLVIECDGDYWHKYPTRTNIDNIRTQELIEKGFKVLRLWEKDIKKISLKEFENEIQKIKNKEY